MNLPHIESQQVRNQCHHVRTSHTVPVDGGGRETAAVAAGLRAAPELDGAAAREKDEDEESGMVTAGALRKALEDRGLPCLRLQGMRKGRFTKRGGASTRFVHN
jgi:hypothetical protein